MAETCIVCLGDLGESANEILRPLSQAAEPEDQPFSHLKSPARNNESEDEKIAHLLPCGHDLHNNCLKPWVERANSCPICRQNFNQVELSFRIGGPVVSSYAVDDRIQVADVDPSMHIEDFDDEDSEYPPCPVCGDDDNEETLLSCDGCGLDFHTYCVDLDDIPRTHWFCDSCAVQRATENIATTSRPRRPHNVANRRTRAERRRERTRIQASSLGWARVWQSVWDRLNLDLDFPFDDVPETDGNTRTLSERRDLREWQRRLQIAERQGGANRFRDTASTLLDLRERREQQAPGERINLSEPESQEEIRAWNALEKAKEIQRDSSTSRRKRKSATASPSDPDASTRPERPLKRPRTRRNLDLVEPSSDSPAESSHSNAKVNASSSRSEHMTRHEGPSFLQSLLKEVETSTSPDESKAQSRPSLPSVADHNSPCNSSPGASPTTSNHASPRALSATPPPTISPRPASPLPLTSRVEPIFPAPEYSPSRSPTELDQPSFETQRQPGGWRQARHQHRPPPESKPPPRAEDVSPSRLSMSFSAKNDLQKMVASALKPHYHSQAVNKDQYTDINRSVSRMLYDRVGEDGNLKDEARDTWERLAVDAVAKAVRALKVHT